MPLVGDKKITVLIAEDEPLIRAGIRALLEQADDIVILAEAQTGEEITHLVAKLEPHILLLDLKMPDLSPADMERWVRDHYPATITLVLTSHDRDAYLANMMDAGATGYLSKGETVEGLIHAIRRAASGAPLFSPEQIARAQRWQIDVKRRWDSLTAREREIMGLLAGGVDNKTMARSLNISLKTVEKHLTAIYEKMGVTTRVEAILWWTENGGDFPN
jgi:DNA-binding NarL/FixJ family response regulator